MSKSPNVLFVFADQMRGCDMRCAGNREMVTPHFDRLAREGVMATRHYATTPLCCPNRATMLTGTYPTTHRLLVNDVPMRFDLPSMGTLARDAGYRTGYIGKWHVHGGDRLAPIPRGACRLGFDDFWAVLNCAHDYFDTKYYRDDSDEMIRVEGYEPEIQTDLALEFLDGQARDARPFCLVLSWGPPHNPYEQVPDEYRAMYPDPRTLTMRPNVRDIPREFLDPAWSQYETIRDYYAQITSLDVMMGRLLDRLEQIGALDDTIVVFTSDHGDMVWSQGLLYKCVPWEESVNVPLLVRWPEGLPRGAVCDALIGTVDLLPTLASLCGWRGGDSFEGLDLAATLRGDADAPRPGSAFISNYQPYTFRRDMPTPAWRGLRTERYTYTETPDRNPWVVCDNQADPYQLTNLAADPAHAAQRAALAAELDRTLNRLGDPFLDGPGMKKHFNVGAPNKAY